MACHLYNQGEKEMKKMMVLVLVVVLIIAILGGRHYYKSKIEDTDQVLYENQDIGIGFLMPKGYKENPFEIEENSTENGVVISFLEPESKALIFSLYYMDRNYWDEEVKENFSAPYSEVYRGEDHVLLCINVSDVQYDVNNTDQWEKYLELWDLKEEICQSLYFIEE